MVGRKKKVLRLDPLAAATMFVPLCQHRPVLLGKRGFEGESLESIHQKLGMKTHCARTSSAFPRAANQPRETRSREATLWDPQGCAVPPRVSTSVKPTWYMPVYPPREQLKAGFYTIIQVKLNIWQFCPIPFGWDCSCSSQWAVCVSHLMVPTAKCDLDTDH